MKVTGILQIVLGSLTIILGVVSLLLRTTFSVVGYPLWCGLFFYIVAGSLGVITGRTRSSCSAIGYMVMSIFACLASCVVIGLSGGSMSDDLHCSEESSCNTAGLVAVNATLICLGLVEFVMSIIGASLTCGAVCCFTPAQTVVRTGQPGQAAADQPSDWKGMKMTGITQIVLGCLTVAAGVISIVVGAGFSYTGYPIWCGFAFFNVAGILGVVAGRKRSQCMAIGYTVMSVFACLTAALVIALSITSLAFYYGYCGQRESCANPGRVGVNATLIVLGLLESVMSIVGACMTKCTSPSNRPKTPALYHTVISYHAQPQDLVVTTGQPNDTYPSQQAIGTTQGQLQPPPQGCQPQIQGQTIARAPPANDPQYETIG